MKPTVSIIVPVYNAEKFLNRCVDSILGQEYRDFELILVDDGSRDMSGSICDAYAKTDERVVVIHKENSGVSDTRNQGIERAKGTYLQFVDSDMVSRKGDIESDCVIDREEFASFMMENPADYYYGVLWNKLYRRDLVNRFGIRMDAEISWCEDFMFNLEYVRYAETFYALRTPVYYYVKTKGSLVNQKISITKTVKMKLMMFEYYNNFYKHVLDEEDYEKNRLQVYHFLVDAAKDGFVFPASIPGNRKLGEERSSALQEVISDDGIIVDKYRDRKLLERYLESAALKHDMTMEELSLLLYLKDASHELSRKNLADLMDLSRGDLAVAVQRLSAKKMVEVTELPRRRGTER